jgi:hypothetical protein
MKSAVTREHWERLESEARSEIETSGTGFLFQVRMVGSLQDGDPTFTSELAVEVMQKVVNNEELNSRERLWLATVLGRLANDSKAALALSGKKGKGAPKKGSHQWQVAMGVLVAIMDGGATSVDDAWEAVAARTHLGPATVRKYWAACKPIMEQAFSDAFKRDGADSFDAALKEMIRNNRGK